MFIGERMRSGWRSLLSRNKSAILWNLFWIKGNWQPGKTIGGLASLNRMMAVKKFSCISVYWREQVVAPKSEIRFCTSELLKQTGRYVPLEPQFKVLHFDMSQRSRNQRNAVYSKQLLVLGFWLSLCFLQWSSVLVVLPLQLHRSQNQDVLSKATSRSIQAISFITFQAWKITNQQLSIQLAVRDGFAQSQRRGLMVGVKHRGSPSIPTTALQQNWLPNKEARSRYFPFCYRGFTRSSNWLCNSTLKAKERKLRWYASNIFKCRWLMWHPKLIDLG